MTNDVKELIDYRCKECGFNGDVSVTEKKVTCPSCGTVNDVWLLGETPPPNHVKEPELEECGRCGCPILKGESICEQCHYELEREDMYDRMALHERYEEAARRGEL